MGGTNPATPPAPLPVPLIVELVGPGGTGKSTVAAILRRDGVGNVVALLHRGAIAPRLRAARTVAMLALKFRLAPRDALSLLRKCSAVEQGLAALRDARPGTTLFDEGPIRTLRDTRCRSYRERAAWWGYARQTLAALAGQPVSILVIHLDLDQQVRLARYAARGTAAAQKRPDARRIIRRVLDRAAGRRGSRSIPTIRRPVQIAAARFLGTDYTERVVVIHGTDSAEDIAARLGAIIAGHEASLGDRTQA